MNVQFIFCYCPVGYSGMTASEYVLALSRSEDRFCRLIQLNIKVEGRLQWTVENPQECLFVLCMENAE